MKLLLLLALCLVQLTAEAWKITVSGRVTEQATGLGVSGATILQQGTTNGTAANAEGYFSLQLPNSQDSVTLTVTCVGFLSQQRRVAAGSRSDFALLPSKSIVCYEYIYPLLEAGLSSGVCYAPLGATVQLYGSRLVQLFPLRATASYQTNLRQNHAFTASLSLPQLLSRSSLTVTEALDYQDRQATPARRRFRGYLAAASVGGYKIGPVRGPDLLVGLGYARQQRIQEAAPAAGCGYTFGLRHRFGYPFQVLITAQATRWPGYWQLQGSVKRLIFSQTAIGIVVNQLPSYAEAAVMLSRTFY